MQAVGCYVDRWVALIDEERLTKLRAKSIVLATGCCELPAVFRNNDLPGVMLASAAQRLIRLYAVRPFDTAVVLTANSDGYRAALDLHAAGVKVPAIVDLRSTVNVTGIAKQIETAGITVHSGHQSMNRFPARNGIRGAIVCPLDETGKPQVCRESLSHAMKSR